MELGPLTTRFDCDGRNGRELCTRCGGLKPAPAKSAPVRTDSADEGFAAMCRRLAGLHHTRRSHD